MMRCDEECLAQFIMDRRLLHSSTRPLRKKNRPCQLISFRLVAEIGSFGSMRSEFSCHDPHPAALRRDSVRGSLRKLVPVWSREAGTICGLAARHQTLPPVSSNVATGNSSFHGKIIYKCGISSKPCLTTRGYFPSTLEGIDQHG